MPEIRCRRDRHGLGPAEADKDHAKRTQKIKMAQRVQRQTAIALGCRVSQLVRRPRMGGFMHGDRGEQRDSAGHIGGKQVPIHAMSLPFRPRRTAGAFCGVNFIQRILYDTIFPMGTQVRRRRLHSRFMRYRLSIETETSSARPLQRRTAGGILILRIRPLPPNQA